MVINKEGALYYRTRDFLYNSYIYTYGVLSYGLFAPLGYLGIVVHPFYILLLSRENNSLNLS